MFSPPTPAVADRMRAAREHAAGLLGCVPDLPSAWGYEGRTVGGIAEWAGRWAWLRVLATPAERRMRDKLRSGTATAAGLLPAAVPRPSLWQIADWESDGYAYRAELTEYVPAPVCSATPGLAAAPSLPDSWWSALRTAVDAVAATTPPSGRDPVISQAWLDRMPRFLGPAAEGMDTTVPAWTLAHGDLHWSNLTAAPLTILDWEGIGLAPAGFDAATLYAYSLPVPAVADQVRRVFADVLDCPAGQFAELAVAASILQAAERDPVHARLAPAVRAHAAALGQSSWGKTTSKG